MVADEVRQLAAKASDASQQIEQLVQQIITQSESIRTLTDDNQGCADEVASSAVQIDTVVTQVLAQSAQMQQVISHAATVSFLNTTKLDHAVWKQNIYELLQNQCFDQPVNSTMTAVWVSGTTKDKAPASIAHSRGSASWKRRMHWCTRVAAWRWNTPQPATPQSR